MIVHPAVQGSDEWRMARVGLPTASHFDQIITPRTLRPSASADKYLHRLVAEWLLGRPLDDVSSGFIERGQDMESDALRWYEFYLDADTTPVGLCLRDDGKVGASPDRLVDTVGLAEFKVPSAQVHVSYLLDINKLADDYRCQVQGELYVCEREWADLVSYNPEMPPVIVRIERDPAFIQELDHILFGFILRLDEARARVNRIRLPEPAPPRDTFTLADLVLTDPPARALPKGIDAATGEIKINITPGGGVGEVSTSGKIRDGNDPTVEMVAVRL